MKINKIGRNEPCPCNSGKKYKKCCGNFTHKDVIPAEVIKNLEKYQKSQRLYGDVRPPISLEFKGYKMVAVGNQIHYSKKWKSFHDFLFDYIIKVLKENWGKEELKKDASEMHPILHWYKEVCAFRKKYFKENDKATPATCTGITGSYLALAYDLYILRHHSKLQGKLLSRIKNKDQFQGARYELYVAASFIKAGFGIDFEDEDNRDKTHCEFQATHKNTKEKYSVEAKSRHRLGFLGQKGKKQNLKDLRLRIGKLLNDALKKDAEYKRIIFVDVNMPPEEAKEFKISWTKPLFKIIGQIEKDQIKTSGPIPAYLFFTNHPAHYIGQDKIDPPKNYFLTAINIPEFKKNDPQAAEKKHSVIFSLWGSINKHGIVPHELDF